MIASLSGHLPEGSRLPSSTNPRVPNFVSTSASHLLPSQSCWPFSGQQLRATTRATATWSLLRSSTSAILSTLKTIPCWLAFRLIISASTIIKDHDAIGHFRIVQKQKNRVEAERISLQFSLYKQRKMQICPLNVDFVLLFFCSYTIRK